MSTSDVSPQLGDFPEEEPIGMAEGNSTTGTSATIVVIGKTTKDGAKLTKGNNLISKKDRAGSRGKRHGASSQAKPGGKNAAEDAGLDGNEPFVAESESGCCPAGDSDGGAGDLNDLVRRAGALMEQHAQEGDHRSSQHLALAPEALRCLKQALALLQDPYAEHEFLVSLLQLSEQSVLTATDDCTDEDKSRETLQLARGLVEDILAHRCLEEVLRKTNYREKLKGHMNQIDEIVGSFLDPPSPSRRSSGDRSSGADQKGGVSSVELKAYEWNGEDRESMMHICDQRYMSMLPLVSDLERVEMVKQRVEWALRSRFKEARVLVFGSSAGQLATPESDIDLTVCLPTRAKLIHELKDKIEACGEAVVTAGREFPEAVRLLEEKTAKEKRIKRLENNLKALKSALGDSTVAGNKKKEHLRRMEAAYQDKMGQETAASNTSSPSTPTTTPSGTPGNTDIPSSEETLPPQNLSSMSSEARPETEASGGLGDPTPEVVDSTKTIASKEAVVRSGGAPSKRGCERRKWKGKRSSVRHVNEENVDKACLEELRALVVQKTETADNLRARVEKAQEGLRMERQACGEWTAKHFRRANPEQKRAINAVTSSRLALERASGNLKATSSIVFQIKRILEMNGFTNVFAVSRSRVPVVKTHAPLNIWGPRDKPLVVDVSVNNLVALHNTRLLFTYTNMDPRFRQLLFLVKAWAKARGVNDSTKGTLSSYGHCVATLHYLIRVGAAPCLLKEHPSRATGSDPSAPTPFILEGIDVSFRMPDSGTSTAPPHLTTGMPQGDGNERAVRQRMSDADNVTTEGTGEQSPRSQNAGLGEAEREGKRVLSPRDAGVCDLLGGYFRYFAKDFGHISQVMTMRPKSVLFKRDVWKKPKLWRTSIEDPFETFDSVNPHDLGAVISRSGQALLKKEWERGYALMQHGGADALEKLFMPCADAVKFNPKHGLRQSEDRGRGRDHGHQRGGGGAPPNCRSRNGGGRVVAPNCQPWNPRQGGALPNQGMPPPIPGVSSPIQGVVSTMHMTTSSYGMASMSYGMATPVPGAASMNYSTAPSLPPTMSVIYTTASSNHGVTSVVHGNGVNIHGTESPNHGMTSVVHGNGVNIHGTASPNHGMTSVVHGNGVNTHGTASSNHGMGFVTHGTVLSNHGAPPTSQGAASSTYGAPSGQGTASPIHGTSTAYGEAPPVQGTMPPPSPQATLHLNQGISRHIPGRHMLRAPLSPRAMQQHPSHNLVLTGGATGGFVVPGQGSSPPDHPPQANGVSHREGGVDQGRRGGRGRGRGGRGKGQRRRERNNRGGGL